MHIILFVKTHNSQTPVEYIILSRHGDMAVLENPRPLISTIKRDIPGNHPQACERFSAWLPALQIFQDQRLDQKIHHIPIAIIATLIFMHGVHGVPSPLFDPYAPDREVAKMVNLFEIYPPPAPQPLEAS